MYVHSLTLRHFRNHANLNLQDISSKGVMIVGKNGVGKTNILEAISLVSAGRSMRGATARAQWNWAYNTPTSPTYGGGWRVELKAAASDPQYPQHHFAVEWEEGAAQRRFWHNFAPLGSRRLIAEFFVPLAITPDHDGILGGSQTEQRRMLDRMVAGWSPQHSALISQLSKLTRERTLLLESQQFSAPWCAALEQQIAEHTVAVAAARVSYLKKLAPFLQLRRGGGRALGGMALSVAGLIEDALSAGEPSVQIERACAEQLCQHRRRDAEAAGRRLEVMPPKIRVTLTDHANQVKQAGDASTGERKKGLITWLIAHVDMAQHWVVPVLLLDEGLSHLDSETIDTMLAALDELQCQCWISSTLAVSLPRGWMRIALDDLDCRIDRI